MSAVTISNLAGKLKKMASTLEEMADIFATKTANLRRCMELRSAGNSSTCMSVLTSIDKELLDMEAALLSFQEHLEMEKAHLDHGKVLKEIAEQLRERLEHVASNLPSHLPGGDKKAKGKSEEQEGMAVEGVKASKRTRRNKLPFSETLSDVPKLAYLTVEEFEEIPKYIKGRVTYDRINNAIDEIHKVIIAKYKILSLSRSAMGEPVMKKYKAFKEAETAETEGEYFFVDEDVKTYSHLKMDSTTRAIFTMLRHCGRLKEVRGKGLLRYVLKL